MRPRILFVSETVSLAQITRLAALAKTLDPQQYDVHFAASAFPGVVDLPFPRHTVWGIDAKTAQARAASGRRLFTRRILRRAIASDDALIAEVRPHLIVGDLRWSLAVSAPKAGVPWAGLINAYWSPFAERTGFPVPDHPAVRLLGEAFVARYMPKALPWIFRHFAQSLDAERAAAGLPPVGDLLAALTAGDHVLYADPPGMVPMGQVPGNHRFMGYIPWSAPGELPDHFGRTGRPGVYVTMGSSGDPRCLRAVLRALAELPVDVLLSTAGRPVPSSLPTNTVALPFVDGDAACARARLVIHNGGSSTGYQALGAGVPVLGLPSNFDQHLASERISASGAGLHLRAGGVRASQVRAAVDRILSSPPFAVQARAWQSVMGRTDIRESFGAFVRQALAGGALLPAAQDDVVAIQQAGGDGGQRGLGHQLVHGRA